MAYIVTGTWKTRTPRPTPLGTPMARRKGLTNSWTFDEPDRDSAERRALDLVEMRGAFVASFEEVKS